MMYMLVRNRVENYDHWRTFFDADEKAAAEHGLKVISLWRAIEDPNNVFFLLSVESVARAQAFLDRPESAEIGQASGVIDGEYHFVEDGLVASRP